MIPVQDTSLRFLLLAHVIDRLRQGAHTELRDAAISPAHVERLRALELGDIYRLAALSDPIVGVILDDVSTDTGLRQLRQLALIKDLRALEDYFILHGASARMMRTLFSLSAENTRERRDDLGLKGIEGRPLTPPVAVRDGIYRFWAGNPGVDLRQRYYRLHEAYPQYRLVTLYQAIKEFERDES